MDEGLLSSISASCGQLVNMLITLELHGIFHYLYFFKKNGGKMTKKRKKSKEKNIGQAWIRASVPQAVGLQESV